MQVEFLRMNFMFCIYKIILNFAPKYNRAP